MLKYKPHIIFLGALSVTVLMNFQRLVITLIDNDISASLGLSMPSLILRMIIMFVYAYTLLSFNLLWKDKWFFSSPSNRKKLLSVLINGLTLLLGAIAATKFRINFASGPLGDRYVFGGTMIIYLVVHPFLLLLARFINLFSQQQQILLEKGQAKQKALQHQLQALRTQINPHFLFNALNSLTVLIRMKSDRALAFVDQLSSLLRSTLQRSNEDFITIQQELEYLRSYIFLQEERFGEKLIVNIDIPSSWETKLIPSFSLQLLVENAIKHNIVSKKQPLLVEIYPDSGYLIIRNQIQKRRDEYPGTGTGLSNLSERFRLLKKREIQIFQDETYFMVRLPILSNL